MKDKPNGRPSQGADVLIHTGVSKAEAMFVQKAADSLGISQAAFVRALIAEKFLDWSTPTEEETPNAK